MILGIVDQRTTPTPLPRHGDGPAPRPLLVGHRHGRLGVHRARDRSRLFRLQLRKRLGEITGVDLLVGRLLGAHDPAVWGARGRADEEELVEVRGLEELGAAAVEERGRFAEVDLCADVAVEQGLAVEEFADAQGVVF